MTQEIVTEPKVTKQTEPVPTGAGKLSKFDTTWNHSFSSMASLIYSSLITDLLSQFTQLVVPVVSWSSSNG